MHQSVTIVIPAFQEENNIEAAIDNALRMVQGVTQDYEIIVVDDASTDKTVDFARLKAQVDPHVRVAVNATNQGIGYSFARGVKMAGKEYITVFPGSNDLSTRSLKDLLDARGTADLIISYPQKGHKGSLAYRLSSGLFTLFMNMLFGLNLKYYNGAFIGRANLLKSTEIKSTGIAVLSEYIVRLIKKGSSWHVIYFEHAKRHEQRSKSFNLKSFIDGLKTISILWRDIYFPARDKNV